MLDIVIILLLGIAPPILSLWMMHRAQVSYKQTTRQINTPSIPPTPSIKSLPPADMICIEGYGYVIGKVSCKYNARSQYIRCAVNPSGPCQDCRYYESL
ncbi:MAG: DUF6464 family protein [Pseudanabaena sp.]|uniref:DUF6464 family protein n=1 Tax=Pseudanabaena mucicola TaxID=71190 RepID=UPI002578CDDA|nr:DUF6464 family protein [Pseudanabaena mucicola]MCA6572702.1 hypothetical protein [Pseudanabaena sp. M53BS1SP1A06MG]MCA6582812.1 hypothetical protein [Pseudanabaena sp. M34BS1SP1A06MG]MCA6589811.1 hypothetical protein [Pseudanabaena sp. M109S1SP1A06QC]MCA6592448.1 hypothetical protein [Pseudanabaena sp. M38BS1SP1A06MG]MCA6597499.1 hypothetical protein [Pseudanabaena sp. M046S1SP1A06QC]MCA6600159.1 hypothetical protein [Pseudanabaena sp. M57BS1SP1A06MG]MCA6603247.1 hypothetical protein [Pse